MKKLILAILLTVISTSALAEDKCKFSMFTSWKAEVKRLEAEIKIDEMLFNANNEAYRQSQFIMENQSNLPSAVVDDARLKIYLHNKFNFSSREKYNSLLECLVIAQKNAH